MIDNCLNNGDLKGYQFIFIETVNYLKPFSKKIPELDH